MNPFPQVDRVTKHTVTLPFGVFEALEAAAESRGLEPSDLIQELVVEHVIAAGTLDKANATETGKISRSPHSASIHQALPPPQRNRSPPGLWGVVGTVFRLPSAWRRAASDRAPGS